MVCQDGRVCQKPEGKRYPGQSKAPSSSLGKYFLSLDRQSCVIGVLAASFGGGIAFPFGTTARILNRLICYDGSDVPRRGQKRS